MKILFLGNSHTYFNGLPFQLRAMLRIADPSAECFMLTTGGMSIGWHARQPETQAAIKYHDWDYIVLQQRSHPFAGYTALRDDCDAIQPLLRRSRAKVLFYMTWSERDNPAGQPAMEKAFLRVSRRIGARPVPVSVAWQKIQRGKPAINLYARDNSHANPKGTYLAACVFYSVLTGQSPVGLPNRIVVNRDTLANIPKPQARRIQTAAWRTTSASRIS